jgi:hypothetical protein
MFDPIRQDAGFALRTLGRQKGWTAVAMITLFGIGAGTVFSVVNTFCFGPSVPRCGADRGALAGR